MFRLFTLTLLWILSNAQDSVMATCSISTYDCDVFASSHPDAEPICCFDSATSTRIKYTNQCYYECNNANAGGQMFNYYCGECCDTDTTSTDYKPCSTSTETCTTMGSSDSTLTAGFCRGTSGSYGSCYQHMACDKSVDTACAYNLLDPKLECLQDSASNTACYFCQLPPVVTTSKPDATTTSKVDPDPTTTSKPDPDPTTTSKACDCPLGETCDKVRQDGTTAAGTCEPMAGSTACGYCKPNTSGCPTNDQCTQIAKVDEVCHKYDSAMSTYITGTCQFIDPCWECEPRDTNPDTTKTVGTTSAPDPCDTYYANNPSTCRMKAEGETCSSYGGTASGSYYSGLCKENSDGCLDCVTDTTDPCYGISNSRCLIDGATVCYGDSSNVAGKCDVNSDGCKICVFEATVDTTTSAPDKSTTSAPDKSTTSAPDSCADYYLNNPSTCRMKAEGDTCSSYGGTVSGSYYSGLCKENSDGCLDCVTDTTDPCYGISNSRCLIDGATVCYGDSNNVAGKCDVNSDGCKICVFDDTVTTSKPDDTTTTAPDDGTTDAPNDDQSTEAPDDGTTTAADDGTTNGPDTTDEPGCDAQKYPFARAKRGDCDDKPPMSCTLVIGLSADVCNINGLFTYYSLAMQLRLTIREIVYELKTDGVANECDLSKIHPYDFSISPIINNVDEDTADLRGSFVPLTADQCPDLDEYCGEDGLKPNYEVSLNLGLRCGSCSELKDIRDALALMVVDGTIDGEFETKCERISAEQDSLCGQGLRDVTLLENPTATLYGEDGSVIEVTEIDISRSDAPHHVYWFAVVVAVFSIFFL